MSPHPGALPLVINDPELLPKHEIVGVLPYSAGCHEHAIGTPPETEMLGAVAELNNRAIAGRNAVRG
jgi:hypothetical protein